MYRKIFLSLICITLTACTSDKRISGSLFLMDTVWNISVSNKQCYDEISETLKNIDISADCHTEKGEAYKLNLNSSAECSDYLTELVEQSLNLSQNYSNRVSISCGSVTDLWQNADTFPNDTQISNALLKSNIDNVIINGNTISLINGCTIDTGAFAKGYALDKCNEVLESNNEDYAVISAVSSILLYGEKPNNEPFKVQIKNPDSDDIIGTAVTNRDFVSTSGGYERFFTIDGKDYNHIIDLENGKPSESDLVSVTVFCDSGIFSDYLSTLIFTEGSENIEKHLGSDDYEVVAFDKKGKSFISKGLDFSYEK